MTKLWPLICDNRRYSIRDGNACLFWKDQWCEGNSFLELNFNPNNILVSAYAIVKMLSKENEEWNIPLLQNILPPTILSSILAVPHPEMSLGSGIMIWNGEDSGRFSIKSAYAILANEKAWVSPIPWSIIWKWKGPENYKFHFWKASHDRLLTNGRKISWGLRNPDCPFCPGIEETTLHVLRGCPRASQIWNRILFLSEKDIVFNMDLFSWLRKSIERDWGWIQRGYWLTFFLTTLYFLWLWRNKTVGEEDFVYPVNHYVILLKKMHEI
ncbi:hypothetical protein RIF29_24619 [Crotalaria pallida]|uniref:Reverse transcriptase zinc-binding domain-containing protein n=1 Tax=Crotalaria pallida TaxID=3830 RepID=A0AAN9EMC7_CROPI